MRVTFSSDAITVVIMWFSPTGRFTKMIFRSSLDLRRIGHI
jgi:hypothetical protein